MARKRGGEKWSVGTWSTLRKLRVPSGEPPVALTGKMTDDILLQWGRKTRDYYRARGHFLMVDGLLYFLRFYFVDPNDHPKAFARAERVLATLGDEE